MGDAHTDFEQIRERVEHNIRKRKMFDVNGCLGFEAVVEPGASVIFAVTTERRFKLHYLTIIDPPETWRVRSIRVGTIEQLPAGASGGIGIGATYFDVKRYDRIEGEPFVLRGSVAEANTELFVEFFNGGSSYKRAHGAFIGTVYEGREI